MKASWFKDCKTKEEKDKVRQVLFSNKDGFDRLKEILEPMLKEALPTADYDSPSWAYKEADRIGYNRALNQVLDIITLDKE